MKASTATRTTAPAPIFEPGDTIKAWLERCNVTVSATVRSFRWVGGTWYYVLDLSNGNTDCVQERDCDFLTAR